MGLISVPDAFEDNARTAIDIMEAAAREAILCGDGNLVKTSHATCGGCRNKGNLSQAVWFNSRGWICMACEEDAVAPTPTHEQRGVGKPRADLQDKMIEAFNRDFM